MNRLGRDPAELTALADRLTAHSIAREMLSGPLPGIYDPTAPGKCCSRSSPRWLKRTREHPGGHPGRGKNRIRLEGALRAVSAGQRRASLGDTGGLRPVARMVVWHQCWSAPFRALCWVARGPFLGCSVPTPIRVTVTKTTTGVSLSGCIAPRTRHRYLGGSGEN